MTEFSENLTPSYEQVPTVHDLQTLEIEASNLGSGADVHAIDHKLGMLRRYMKQSEREGWPNYLKEAWYSDVREIKEIILRVKEQKARELGF